MADESSAGLTESTIIDADVDTIRKALLDFDSYPEWMSGVDEMEVLKRDRKKRGTEVRYKVDAVMVKINYVLEYEYIDDENRIVISYKEGDLEDCNASYTFEQLDSDRTEVTYYFDIRYNLPKTLRGPLVKRLLKTVDKRVMKSALGDLKKRAESL